MKIKTVKSWLAKSIAALIAGGALAAHAAEPTPITMCAFTFMGEGGPEHQALLDYQTAALSWGVKLTLKPYINEKIVAEELKSGVCDIANMSSVQARNFNKFTGTLDAPASMPTYKHLQMIMGTISKPNAAKYMRNGDYEVIGIQPAGQVYLFMNDRSIQGLSDMAGKKIGILDTMPEMRELVTGLGMTPVSSTMTNMFQKFNNGATDITGGPAIVYDLMELHKGIGTKGGILSVPLIQSNNQFVARWSKLPEGFAQKSREFFVNNFDKNLAVIRTAEDKIPKNLWVSLPDSRMGEYDLQTRNIRLKFRSQNIYDAKMLTLMRKVRCQLDATLGECTAADAE
ncbi:RND type efflux pump involved in aminoglycoside resistance [gamma proteobacterium HdN1]|nr:RND type efflux pump involved in aminoglycoside resistance [gamma proteobacterium HdN1]